MTKINQQESQLKSGTYPRMIQIYIAAYVLEFQDQTDINDAMDIYLGDQMGKGNHEGIASAS